MCQASNAAAANRLRTAVVVKFMKPFYVAEQAQRESLERRQKSIARLPPEPKFDIWGQES